MLQCCYSHSMAPSHTMTGFLKAGRCLQYHFNKGSLRKFHVKNLFSKKIFLRLGRWPSAIVLINKTQQTVVEIEKRIYTIFERFIGNSCDEEDIDLLIEFIRRPDAKEKLKNLMNRHWEKIESMEALKETDIDAASEKLFSQIMQKAEDKEKMYRMPPPRRRFQWYHAAAVLLIGVVSALALYHFRAGDDLEPVWFTKTNVKGQKSTVTLLDGTTVRLNAESELLYPKEFTGNIREVVLKGEAFFNVTEDSERPFIVRTGDLATTVLGTSFNIRAYENEDITVTVATGKVQVATSSTAQASTALLTPRQQATYDPATGAIEKKEVVLDKYLAWKDGILLFDCEPFGEVVDMLERWYGVSITLENEGIRQCIVRGRHKDESLVNVLKTIGFALKIEYELTSEGVVIRGGRCKQ